MQGTVDGFSYGLVTPVVAFLMASLGGALGLRCTTRSMLVAHSWRPGWLALGSVAIASGIWTMHFVAMMGFKVRQAPIHYDKAMTFASLGVAIVMVGIGIFIVGYRGARGTALFTGGTITGLGIASMHYLGMAAMRLYRHLFKPSETLARPYAMIGVPVVAAPTDEEARRLSTTQQLKFLSLVRGNRLQLQPPVDSMDGLWNEWEREAVNQRLGAAIVGGPETVKRRLEALVAETEADEVMIVSDFYDIADRLRSFEIVAALKQRDGVPTTTAA